MSWAIVGWLGFCAAVGVAGAVDPKYALAAIFGLAFVVIAFTNLVYGIAIFAGLSFLETLTNGSAVSFDKAAGLILVASWLFKQGASRDAAAGSRGILSRHPAMFASILAYLAWTVISIVWAPSASPPIVSAYRLGEDLLLIPITYVAVRTPRDLRVIVLGYIIGAACSAVYGFLVPTATSSGEHRLNGALGEANAQATVLIAGIVLTVGMALYARRSPRLRSFLIAAVILSFIAMVKTESRAGLIAFGAVLLAGVMFSGPWRKRAARLLLIGVVAVIGWFVLLAPSAAVTRVTSGNSSGRNDIWTVGWRVFEAHPWTGVGGDEFEHVSAHYLNAPGLITSSNYFLITPKVVHNIYLQQLADLGLPGLVLLLAILIAGLSAPLRAARIFAVLGDRELELMSRCAIIALVAFLAADFFASEVLSKQLWIVFALGPALLKLAEQERRAARG